MGAERLFISHASEDAETVNVIVAYLESRGVACWIASRDIPPRSIYAEAITEGIEACSACAVIVSAASNASDAVKRELELASHERKPFIPIRIDATEPGRGLAYYLRNAQWIDYRREGERALDRLAGAAPAAVAPAVQAHAPIRDESTPNRNPDMIWIGGAAALMGILGVVWLLWPTPPENQSAIAPAAETLAAPVEGTAPAPADARETTQQAADTQRAQREARLPQATWMRHVRENRIVPGESIAGFRIGQSTQADVIALLGQPTRQSPDSLDYGSASLALEFDFAGESLRHAVLIDENLLLTGLGPTVRGVGIGSPLQRSLAAIGVAPDGYYDDCAAWGGAGILFNAIDGRISAISVSASEPGNIGCR